MSMHWISKWTTRLADYFAYDASNRQFGEPWDYDADRQRARNELDAVRVRFQDHR